MLITDEKFFCEELDTSVKGLEGIDVTFREKGLAAAEKQLAQFVRANVRADDYFKTPYYERENAWYHSGEDDYAVAERIMTGRVISCGYEYQFPNGKIEWSYNPTPNQYREWTWQLSRHHEWRCLAHCYKETGDPKYARAYVDFLMNWCEQAICPESASGGATECWRTLEAGLRMIKIWHYCFFTFYKTPEVTDHVITTYMKSVWEHGYRLRPSTSAANWLTTELTGLAHIGMLYPFLRKSAEWKEYALRRLEEEIEIQFYPDGFHYELTTGYHGVVTANYRYLLDICAALGEKLPDTLHQKLEVMYEMFPRLVAPDWKTPALNDGGRAGAVGGCADGAKYFPERSDYVYFASNGKEGTPPAFTSSVMPYSGMASLRTSWDKKAVWFFMDSGPFGRGHQHEDKLNVLMYAYGKDVLSDSGSYAYDRSEMRHFIIDTRSHNCALVDLCDQRRRKTYRWTNDMIKQRSNLKWSFTGAIDAIEGVYDEGFGEELIPVTQTRKCIFFKEGISGTAPFALVIDRFASGDGKPHSYDVIYQMNVQPYTLGERRYDADFGDGVTMSVIGSAEMNAVVGQKTPIYMGWRPDHSKSGTDHEHFPAPCLCFNAKGETARVVTALYPSEGKGKMIASVEASDDVASTEIVLVLDDGQRVTVNEADYAVSGDGEEKLYI